MSRKQECMDKGFVAVEWNELVNDSVAYHPLYDSLGIVSGQYTGVLMIGFHVVAEGDTGLLVHPATVKSVQAQAEERKVHEQSSESRAQSHALIQILFS